MDDSNKHEFRDLINATSEYYRQDNLSTMAMRMHFAALQKYSIDQIQTAISKHIQSQKHGQFFPKAADIIRMIEGGEITADNVIAAARLKETPFGILCRIHIGHYDLEHNTDMFYLKQRAEECLQKLPGWKARAQAGEYTDHEISIMIKHQVDPVRPFINGLPAPRDAAGLRLRVQEVSNTQKHRYLLEEPYRGDNEKSAIAAPEVKEFIAIEMDK